MRTSILPILVLFSTAQASASGDLDLPPALQHGHSHRYNALPLEGESDARYSSGPLATVPSSSYIIPSSANGPSASFDPSRVPYGTSQGSALILGRVIPLGRTISQHFQVVNKVGIPVAQPVPVPVERKVPVPVPHPIDVPVDRPYPVHVPVKVPWKVFKNVPVPVEKRIYIPVNKIYSKIHVRVPHKIYHYEPVPVKIWKKVPVPVSDPVLVARPVPVAVHGSHGDLYHHHHKHETSW